MAVLALCAFASASASASQFYVGGKALTGSAKLSTTVKVEEPIVFSSTFDKTRHIVITCKGASLEKGESTKIEAPGTVKLSYVNLTSCSITGVGKCEMESEITTSGSLEASLATGTAPEDTAVISTARNLWMLVGLSGETSCAGDYTGIDGKLPVKVVNGQKEEVEQEFVGEGEAGKGLELAGWGYEVNEIPKYPRVYVTGKFKLKLESGQAWSYH